MGHKFRYTLAHAKQFAGRNWRDKMRQQIAQTWKIVETKREGDTFPVTVRKLGKYTAYTAHGKMIKMFPGYRFVAKPFHGYGGYWVSPTGDTAEICPA